MQVLCGALPDHRPEADAGTGLSERRSGEVAEGVGSSRTFDITDQADRMRRPLKKGPISPASCDIITLKYKRTQRCTTKGDRSWRTVSQSG